jgi:hypothetical protein
MTVLKCKRPGGWGWWGGGFLRMNLRFRHSRGLVDLKGVVKLSIVFGIFEWKGL